MMSSGSHANPIAIMARCRMPPENSCGNEETRRSGSGIRTFWRRSTHFSRTTLAKDFLWISIGSPTCRPMVRDGFKDVIGSWKIMAILSPLIFLASGSDNSRRSVPANLIWPETISPGGFGINLKTESAVTLFPEPLSPTIATVSPASTVKDTPSTALTIPPSDRK